LDNNCIVLRYSLKPDSIAPGSSGLTGILNIGLSGIGKLTSKNSGK